MLRRLIALSAAGLTLQLCVTALWPIGRGVLRDPAMLVRYGNAVTLTAGLVGPLCLIVFLVFLYREIAGRGAAAPRRAAALMAAAGTAVQAAYYFANWLHTRAMLTRLQHDGLTIPSRPDAGLWAILYLLSFPLWIVFLVSFWTSPAVSSRSIRLIAPLLAVCAGALGLRLSIGGFIAMNWTFAVVSIAATLPLFLLLCLMSRTPREL